MNNLKKEGKFSFRCSEDKSSIEMYNKINDKFDIYEDCSPGECKIQNGLPICIKEEAKKEGFNQLYLLIATIILLVIFQNKWRFLK